MRRSGDGVAQSELVDGSIYFGLVALNCRRTHPPGSQPLGAGGGRDYLRKPCLSSAGRAPDHQVVVLEDELERVDLLDVPLVQSPLRYVEDVVDVAWNPDLGSPEVPVEALIGIPCRE